MTREKHQRKLPRALTTRALVFIGHVLQGKSQSDAYRLAYNRPNIADQAAAERGSLLAHKPAVMARIAQARRKAESRQLLSLNDRLSLLAESIRAPAPTSAARNARANCIKVYNMTGGDGSVNINLGGQPGGAPVEVADVRPLSAKAKIALLVAAKLAQTRTEDEA